MPRIKVDQIREEILRAIDNALTPSRSQQPDSQPESEVPHEEVEPDSPLETEVFESLYRQYQTDIQSLQEVLNESNKMDVTRVDIVHEEIEILLRRWTEEELKHVAIDIEINTDALSRRQLLREIENKINSIAKENLWKFLKDLNFPDRLKDEHINFFRSTPITKQDKSTEDADIAKIRDEQKIFFCPCIPHGFYFQILNTALNCAFAPHKFNTSSSLVRVLERTFLSFSIR